MREIKFRAWCNKRKVMLNNVSTGTVEIFDRNYCIPSRDCEFMQFTGLKDKNGKEIFEGDVLSPGYDEDIEYFVVVFRDGRFCEQRLKPGCALEEIFIMDGSFIRKIPIKLEIIGNIWENPELLENKNAN